MVATVLAVVVAGCSSQLPLWSPMPEPSATASASSEPTSAPSPSAEPSLQPSPSPAPAARPFPGGWSFVKDEPCPNESTFTCTTLAVPRDHYVQGGPTWEVTFAFRAASGERRGTHVVITGGPGTSGIDVADSYIDEDHPSVVGERYDTIFLDQRGIGLSHPIQCPEATAVYYFADYDPFETAGAKTAADAARTYVTDCLAEAGADEADLPYYSTRQAIEDLEAFLDHKDVDTISLYGESYGTQYAQAFAQSHPERIQTLFLDGPVDLTQTGIDWLAEQSRGYDDVLHMTLAACAADEACAADFAPSTPLAAFDELQARLEEGPVEVDFPLPDGTTDRRPITAAMLDIAIGTITGPDDRMVFQRVLASAADDNLVPIARIAYAYSNVDPTTEEGQLDPTWSDAMYYAVDCMDDARFPDAPGDDEQAAAFLAAGIAQGMDDLRMSYYYATELPCAYWPNQSADPDRPEAIVSPPYTTFVLGATGDPSTPVANVHRIAARMGDAYSLIAEGGHHIIFGWGNDCPDQILAAYLEDGTLPPSRTTICPDTIVDPYVPVAAAAPAGYADALSFASSMDDQVNYDIDYWYWSGEEPLKVGCDHGGTLTFTPSDTGADLAFAGCAYTAGMEMTGSGAIDYESGATSMTIDIPDGAVVYARDGDGNQTVGGTFQGAAANASP
jgi:pimeloyl-ACP methyl ester carboxylesterase